MSVGRRVIARVETDPMFNPAARDMMLSAGSRLVQSTPIFDRSGHLLGMFSTHYKRPGLIGARELNLLDSLAWAATAAMRASNPPASIAERANYFLEAEICRTEMKACLLIARMKVIADEFRRIERDLRSCRGNRR